MMETGSGATIEIISDCAHPLDLPERFPIEKTRVGENLYEAFIDIDKARRECDWSVERVTGGNYYQHTFTPKPMLPFAFRNNLV